MPRVKNLFVLALCLWASAGLVIAQEAHLAWDPPAKSKVLVTGYVVRWGTRSGVYPKQLIVGKTTSAVIRGLRAGRTYYFVVGAYHLDPRLASFGAELKYTVPR